MGKVLEGWSETQSEPWETNRKCNWKISGQEAPFGICRAAPGLLFARVLAAGVNPETVKPGSRSQYHCFLWLGCFQSGNSLLYDESKK